MAYSEETKLNVRNAYVRQRLPLAESARRHDVSIPTARKWKRDARDLGDDWDTARQSVRMAQGSFGEYTKDLLEDFATQFKAAMDEVRKATDLAPKDRADVLAKLADSYSKVVATAAKSNPELAHLSVGLEVLKLLGEYIQRDYPQHAMAFMEVLEPFGAELSKHYG